MTFFKTLGLVALACGLLQAQSPVEDPVMKARTQRAQAQGVSEGDLPPVPKGIIEPPPLPPPELHVRDMVRSSRATTRASRVARRKAGRRVKVARGKAGREKVVQAKGRAQKTKATPKAVKTAKKRGKRR
ncbi:hypothetical protein [Holophaga foetida]|uniref:hypothetical protein n=1 Tax=Holophaga foetida TaxID=35839 RepID=UPI00024736F7|nr:hypothetical protein [Holophaga foetida]